MNIRIGMWVPLDGCVGQIVSIDSSTGTCMIVDELKNQFLATDLEIEDFFEEYG